MSIFPERAKCYRAPHKQGAGPDAPSYAEPSARSIAEQSDAGINRKMRSEDMASSKTEHRFDKFAKKLAANMLAAIRTSLSVFSSPDKERWPAHRLLVYLKGAEALARDMLREIAAKLTLTPQPLRERRSVSANVPREVSIERAPCFRLGVMSHIDETEDPISASPSRLREGDRGGGHLNDQSAPSPLTPLPRTGRGGRGMQTSSLQSRLAALEDVLQHPGKHAARMARALYRAEHGSGQRLIAKSPDDVFLDRVDAAHGAFNSGDAKAFAKLHAQWLDPG